jgi:hypothetical protein
MLTLTGLLEALLNEIASEASVTMTLALAGLLEAFINEVTPPSIRLALTGLLEALLNEVTSLSIKLEMEGIMGAFASAIRLSLDFVGSIQQTLASLSALAGRIQLGLGGVLQAVLVAPKILNLKTLMYIMAFFGFLTYYTRILEDLTRSGGFYNITIFLVRIALAPSF